MAAASSAAAPAQQNMPPFGAFAFNATGAVKLGSQYGRNYFSEHEHPGFTLHVFALLVF